MKTFEVLNSEMVVDQRTFRPKLNITLSIDIHGVCDGDTTTGTSILLAINEAIAKAMGGNKELLTKI